MIRTMRACLMTVLGLSAISALAAGRVEQTLSGKGWRLWRDVEAKWKEDDLFLPGTDLAKIAANPPTGGWNILSDKTGMEVGTPGTVEQYLGTGEVVDDNIYIRNNPTQDLTGVSWWWRTLQIPSSSSGKRVLLRFEAVRERAEVYLDDKLVGYDIVGSTPFEADVTEYVKPGQKCQLAVRVTNPGGTFSWGDVAQQPWGKFKLPLSRNFSGITGPVKLVVCDPVSIDDLYVQNTPGMFTVNLQITLRNRTPEAVRRTIVTEVLDPDIHSRTEKGGTPNRLHRSESRETLIPCGDSQRSSKELFVPLAKLWDLDHPKLYVIRVTLSKGQDVTDSDERTFGFRWFAPEGFGTDALFRLNGKKIVLRSAISWGYWGVSGIVPSPEQADRQIRVAKQFGLNMLNFHRCM